MRKACAIAALAMLVLTACQEDSGMSWLETVDQENSRLSCNGLIAVMATDDGSRSENALKQYLSRGCTSSGGINEED